MTKKLLALFLVLVMAMSLIACAATPTEEQAPTEADEHYTIGFLAQDWSIAYFAWVRDGFRMSMNEGDEVLCYSYENDVNKEISIIEDLIAKQVDFIVCNCYEVEGLYPVFMQAKEAGIPIITYEKITTYTDLVVSQIRTDDADMGYQGTSKLIEILGGKGLIAQLEIPSSVAITGRLEGFRKAAAEATDITVVDPLPQGTGSSDTEGNTVAFDACLQKNPDLAGYFGTNQNSTLAFVSSAEAAGMLDQVSIVTVDATDAMQELLKEGKIDAIIDQQAYLLGEMIADSMYDYLGGSTPEASQTVPVKIVTMDEYDAWVKESNDYTARAEALGDI